MTRPPSAGAVDTLDAGHWQDWALSVDGVTLPLRPERDSRGDLKVFGVRYASFAPRSGLHPVLGSQAPLAAALMSYPVNSCGASMLCTCCR